MSDSQKSFQISEKLLEIIVDQTFLKYGIKPEGNKLSKEETKRFLETVDVLQDQAMRFLENPQRKYTS